MSNLHSFLGKDGMTQVALPFDLSEMIECWASLRTQMLREVPPEFTRDEWAYLASFLDKENLQRPFTISFGLSAHSSGPITRVARPRSPVALWLPNNVSLLGPLMLVVISLTGSALRMKAGSRSQDLTGAFLEFAASRAQELLRRWLRDSVRHEVFSSEDSRNLEMADVSAVRIVFGSDQAAAAIHAMPHPIDSEGISFTDRRSEAWLEPACCDEHALRNLIKVFAIYGQAGCTSPSRVILLDASAAEALALRDRLVNFWPNIIRRVPEMNIASDNIRACQLARIAGWDSVLADGHRAVVSVGDYTLATLPALMELRIIPASPGEALAQLPANIQTIGYCLRDAARWLERLAATKVARFVPLATMHNFETVWDGQDFFSQLFLHTRVQS